MEIHKTTTENEDKKYRKLIQNAPKITLRSSLEPLADLLGCWKPLWLVLGTPGGPCGIPFGDHFRTLSLFGRSWDLKMGDFSKGPF